MNNLETVRTILANETRPEVLAYAGKVLALLLRREAAFLSTVR